MPEADSHYKSLVAREAPGLPKRRKVRKGTQSCWECKRRKIRCTFTAPTEAVCDGCKSRRTKCTKQEFQEDVVLAGKKVDRVSRVEILVEQLLQRVDIPDTSRPFQMDLGDNVQQEVGVTVFTLAICSII